MLNTIDDAKKNLLLGGLFLVMLMAWYVYFLKPFMFTYTAYEALKGKTILVNNPEQRLNQLKYQKKKLDQSFANFSNYQTTPQEVLKYLSGFKNIRIHKIYKTHQWKVNAFRVYTNEFVIQGSYNDLIKVLQSLEKKNRLAMVTSAKFEIKTDFNNQKELFLDIILQSYDKVGM